MDVPSFCKGMLEVEYTSYPVTIDKSVGTSFKNVLMFVLAVRMIKVMSRRNRCRRCMIAMMRVADKLNCLI